MVNFKTLDLAQLDKLYNELFPEGFSTSSTENRSTFSSALLSSILKELQEDQGNQKPPRYQKLQIRAQWNPPQVVEVEPPIETNIAKLLERIVEVKPLKRNE